MKSKTLQSLFAGLGDDWEDDKDINRNGKCQSGMAIQVRDGNRVDSALADQT